jgi:hypothetical protein
MALAVGPVDGDVGIQDAAVAGSAMHGIPLE